MTGDDPIPAIREEDATGETATIFADLRATLGVPFVNLIWRHLATIPGGLAPVWATLRPLYATGELHRRQAGLLDPATLPPIAPVPAHVWEAAGLDRRERARIRTLIGEYGIANGANLLGLSTVLALLRGDAVARGSGAAVPTEAAVPVAASGATPRLLGLSELSPALLETVRDLDGYGRLDASPAIASLYRHLAHWPAFLALAHTALGPHHASRALTRAGTGVVASARAQALDLAGGLSAPARLPEGDARQRVAASLDEFTRLMIGRMVAMGAALDRLLPAEERAASS